MFEDIKGEIRAYFEDVFVCLVFNANIKTFQKCTIKNKEVEIMEGWCMSGYDVIYQWSLN
jgi:hypothetical protein